MHLGDGASLSGIRNSNVAAVGTTGTFINAVPNFNLVANQDAGAIEPEYVTVSKNEAFVTLQDNNAIGVFDLTTNKWEKINNLGTITMTIDGSDNDGHDGGANTTIIEGGIGVYLGGAGNGFGDAAARWFGVRQFPPASRLICN